MNNSETKVESASEVLNAKMQENLKICGKILGSKGSDYGYDNFVHAAKVASIVAGTEIKPHWIAAALVGIKLARYGNLTAEGKVPEHESIDDTIRDAVNYLVLMDRERVKYHAVVETKKQDSKGSSPAST